LKNSPPLAVELCIMMHTFRTVTLRSAILCLSLLTVRARAGEPPRIDNRAPQPDQWGYRPRNGTTVRLNPPSLTWLLETGAATYTVQWAPQADFAEPVTALESKR
jgi:hypothetical protein